MQKRKYENNKKQQGTHTCNSTNTNKTNTNTTKSNIKESKQTIKQIETTNNWKRKQQKQ